MSREFGFESARDITERETIAASFKFNGVVSELQAKLDCGERLFRPVTPVKAVERQEDVGAGIIDDSVWNLY